MPPGGRRTAGLSWWFPGKQSAARPTQPQEACARASRVLTIEPMEATTMKLIGVMSAAVLSLTLGVAAPANAQKEQQDKQEEEKPKPAPNERKPEPEKPVKQEEKSPQPQEKNVKPEERTATEHAD